MITIGINGFTRTVRNFIRLLCDEPALSDHINVALINIGPGDLTSLPHLLKYDAVLGTYPLSVRLEGDFLCMGNRKIRVCAQPDVTTIDWAAHGISCVVEASGMYRSGDDRKLFSDVALLLMYPALDVTNISSEVVSIIEKGNVVTYGAAYDQALTALLRGIDTHWGIEVGTVTVFDAYTNDDLSMKEDVYDQDSLTALSTVQRNPAGNIIPYTTLKNHISGYPQVGLTRFSMPLERVSWVECCLVVRESVTQATVARALQANAQIGKSWSDRKLISWDIRDDQRSLVIDGTLLTVQGSIIKICGWYDAVTTVAVNLRDGLQQMGIRTKKYDF